MAERQQLQESSAQFEALHLCSYCGQVWRKGYTARCGVTARSNAGQGGPCEVGDLKVVPRSVAEALAEALRAVTCHPGAGHVESCASCSGPVACDCGFSNALAAHAEYRAAYPKETPTATTYCPVCDGSHPMPYCGEETP